MLVAGVWKLGVPMTALAASRALSSLYLGQTSARSLLSSCVTRNARGCHRVFWTLQPSCMGRRSSKIAMRKSTQDAKKSKLYGKLGKQIVTSVKAGGPNPAANAELALLIDKAKQYDIPKDIIDRYLRSAQA